MLRLFRHHSDDRIGRVAAPRARRSRRQRLALETLEGRQLMSLGQEFLANTKTLNDQTQSDNATAANGISVAVWRDEFSSTDHDIRAQMFNANGTLRGSEIIVDFTSADSSN